MKKQLKTKEICDDLVHTLGDPAPSYSTVKKWCHELNLGRESCDDVPHPGRPSTVISDENVDRVHDMVMADRRLTIRKIAQDVGVSYGTVQSILVDVLDMRKLSARWVPRILTADHKRLHVITSQ